MTRETRILLCYQTGDKDTPGGPFEIRAKLDEEVFAALERHFRGRAYYKGIRWFEENGVPMGEIYHVRCDDGLTYRITVSMGFDRN